MITPTKSTRESVIFEYSVPRLYIIISFYSYTVHLHKNKYTGIEFWSIFTLYLRNVHIHIHHLPDLKE